MYDLINVDLQEAMKTPVYNQKGEEISKVDLPAEIFDVELISDLVHQVVVAQMSNARKVIAHTKDRSERRGGGRKPWRQKGTGRARVGSNRSPIWRGGGITFGPTKDRNFSKKINKKMKTKALFMSLTSKVKDQEFVLLDKMEITESKTKVMAQIFSNLKDKIKKDLSKSVLIVLPQTDLKISRAVKNIPKIKTIRADSLNVLDVLSHRYLIMFQESIKVIKGTYL
ncbi:50S ribosomal protein L4 [Patescibacteria group bacterium]|nr:50S ribosomal protein L4 [Patescibacteria group bacterium]MBU1563865.1 50S ribosomal protein L4 [Patescibacteria group bacterium]